VGLQCHFSVGDVDSVKLASTIRKFADAGLKCIITELDMGIGSTSDDDLEQQALNYRVITDIVLDNDNCPNMVIWGLKDNDSWRSGSSPLLYDANLTKKPAYYAVRSALRHRTLDPSTTTGQVFVLDEKFTRLADMVGKSFAVVNDDEGKALYGPSEQNLAYDDVATALSRSNAVICFKLEKRGGSNFLLRGMTPQGWEYSVWDKPGYLNSQPADGWCSFILGLNDQYGEDMKDGAVWTIRYTDGQGFSLLNRGTGKYLHDASPAKYDDPVYFNFYTIKRSSTVGIASQTVSGSKPLSVAYYDLNGRRVGADARGLIIRRTVMSDGSTLVEKMIR
jgi:hypothetical protein